MKNNFKMTNLRPFLILIICFFPRLIYSQDKQSQDFGVMLQTYSQNKDDKLIVKTISYLNSTSSDYKRDEPILIGFFGALISSDTLFKVAFKSEINNISKSEYKKLFSYLMATNIDTIYSQTNISPTFNDMHWASYFATENLKFIGKIVELSDHSKDRKDMNFFLTGESALWSLCANAKQDNKIKTYLMTLKESYPIINEILKKSPDFYQQEMVDVLKEQKSKGIWNF